MKPLSLYVFLFVAQLCFAGSVCATNYFVNDGSQTGDLLTTAIGNNANPGTSTAPFLELKFVIDNVALTPGDSVFVDVGTYADERIDIGAADAGVVIMGADRDLVVFDQLLKTEYWMDIAGNDVHLYNMTVTHYGFSTGLNGQALTIRNCTGALVENLMFDDEGSSGGEAAVYITTEGTQSTNATFNSCVCQNTVGNFGGGIDVCANTLSAVPTLTVVLNDCVIENNSKDVFLGGGLLVYNGLSAGGSTQPPLVTVNNSAIGTAGRGNQAMHGGGIYVDDGATLNLNSVCVSNNTAIDVAGPDGGGGLYVFDGIVNFNGGMVTSNTANLGTPKYGGGIYINKTFTGTSTLNASRVVVSGNTGLDGGGLYMDRATVDLRNCLFYDNVSNDEGGAICVNDGSANLVMYNCTVTENQTLGSGSDHGGLENKNNTSTSIKNCLFWNNTNRSVSDDGGGSLDISFSIIDPANGPVFNDLGNNSTADPLFLNAALDDFRLLNNTSPAFDSGTLDGGTAPTDDLVTTVRTAVPDMGAYELGAINILPLDCPVIRNAVLPVGLVAFTGKANAGGNHVSWITSFEVNSDFFVLEKSEYGVEFEAVHQVAGAGNSASQQDYFYVDALPYTTETYYRLKHLDWDGSESYSSTILVRDLSAPEVVSISHSVFPHELKVWIKEAAGQSLTLELFDLQGHPAARKTDQVEGDVHSTGLDVAGLPAGGYVLRVWADGVPVYVKLVPIVGE